MLWFDYDLQCWVKNGIVQRCGHQERHLCACIGRFHAGKTVYEVREIVESQKAAVAQIMGRSHGIVDIIVGLWILTACLGYHAYRRWDYMPPKIRVVDGATMQVYTVYDQDGRPKEAAFTIIESTKAWEKQ